MQGRIAEEMQQCTDRGKVPDWMLLGKTNLAMKDETKNAEVCNYRPIARLPTTFKLIADSIYGHVDQQDLLPVEQKGSRRNTRGTKKQLLINKILQKNCRRSRTSLNIAWTDYKKAHDMVPHSCMDARISDGHGSGRHRQEAIKEQHGKLENYQPTEQSY